MGFNYFYRAENPFLQLSDNGQVVWIGTEDRKKRQNTDLSAHLPDHGKGTSTLSCLPPCKEEALSTDHCPH